MFTMGFVILSEIIITAITAINKVMIETYITNLSAVFATIDIYSFGEFNTMYERTILPLVLSVFSYTIVIKFILGKPPTFVSSVLYPYTFVISASSPFVIRTPI